MKIKTVEISNFMAITKATVSLADRGLVLVQGETDESSADSNGAGKSSLFDAVSWCLYGETARGEDGDKVVNRTTGKDCRVEVTIEDGTEIYKISRHRKHKKCKNGLFVWRHDPTAIGEPGKDLTKGTDKLTQELVNTIIGCSSDVFNGAVYFGQEKTPDLPGMTDKSLKMLIEEASGATLLEAAYQEARTRLSAAQTEYNTASNNAERAATKVSSGRTALDAARAGSARFEVNHVENLKLLIQEGLTEKKAIHEMIAKVPNKAPIVARIAELDKAIAAVDAELGTDRENAAAVAEAGRVHTAAELTLSNAKKVLANHKERFAALEHKVGCPCDACDRPFSAEDIEPAKVLALKTIADDESIVENAQKSLDTATKRLARVTDARDAFRATMTDLTKTNDERASLQAHLRSIEASEAAIAKRKSKLEELTRNIKAKRDEENPFVDEIERCKKQLDSALGEVHAAKGLVERAEHGVKLAELVSKVYSPTGVRAFLLDEVTPFLNDQTAKYLGTLTDGHISATWTTLVKSAKGDLREKFSIEVATEGAGETFKSISGGEKRKVRIACALALQDLVARRATKPIELVVGDEIDDALDNAGRERLMAILEEKAKEKGSIFIISHSDLKSWVGQTITVRKTDGCSTIVESMS